MKRTLKYAISEQNKFGNWAYSGKSVYYLASVVGVYCNTSGELLYTYYKPLHSRFAYKNKKIESFRGLEVIKE